MSIAKRERFWLNRKDTAASLGISTQAFDAWRVEPVARLGGQTYFDLASVLARKLAIERARWESQNAAPADELDIVKAEREEKLRLTRAQAEGQELKNSQTRRELAPVRVIELVVAKAGQQIVAILDALPMQMKKRNPRLTASDLEVLRREIAKAQNVAAGITVDLDEVEAELGLSDDD